MMQTTIYLPTAEGLNIVSGSEESWVGRSVLQGTQIQCVAVDPNIAGRVYCGTFGAGILISDDTGLNWRGSRELQTTKATALCAAFEGMLYAGTEPSEVYRSDDGGETWRALTSLLSLPSAPDWSFPPRPETNHIQAILVDRSSQGRLHVAVEAGALLRTDDGGESWRDRVPGGPFDTHTLSADPLDSNHLFSAAGDGCFESFDGGSTWNSLMEGLDQTYCWSIAVHPDHPEALLLSASEFAFTAHSPKAARSLLYKRTGSGPWKLAMDGLSTFPHVRIPVIAAGAQEPETFYLATEAVVFRSQNSGLQWERLPIKWKTGSPIARHSLSITVSQTAEAAHRS